MIKYILYRINTHLLRTTIVKSKIKFAKKNKIYI